jgi:hypothetical protein
MGWKKVDLSEVQLNGISRADFDSIWGVNMQLWRPDNVPAGATYYKLTQLTYDTSGNMGVFPCATVGCAIAQGWKDGPSLPPDSIPNGGDPIGYPNRGNVNFCAGNGMAEFVWGPGEGFAPENEEGAHWFWIPTGPSAIWSDVVYGFGWRLGTNHYKLWPVFEKVDADEPPVEPPGDGSVAAEFEALQQAAEVISEAMLTMGVCFGNLSVLFASGIPGAIAEQVKSHLTESVAEISSAIELL